MIYTIIHGVRVESEFFKGHTRRNINSFGQFLNH